MPATQGRVPLRSEQCLTSKAMSTESPAEEVLRTELADAGEAVSAPLCPIDRLPRRRRNKICIAIIALGAVNFLVYTVSYAALGGDAHNGYRRPANPTRGSSAAYFVRGHFLRSLTGQEREVSKIVWIYSYIHSISVLVTSAAMIISMLLLARPHIIATMRDGWVSGPTFVTAFATITVVIAIFAVLLFAWDFITQLGSG